MNANSGNSDVGSNHVPAVTVSMGGAEIKRSHSMRVKDSENGKVVLPPLSHQIHSLQHTSHVLSQPLIKPGTNVSSYRYLPNNIQSAVSEGDAYSYLLNKQNKGFQMYNQPQGSKPQEVADDAMEAAKLVVNFSNKQQQNTANNAGNYFSVYQQQQTNTNNGANVSNGAFQQTYSQNHAYGGGSAGTGVKHHGLSPIEASLAPTQIPPPLLAEHDHYHNNGVPESDVNDWKTKNKVTKPRKREQCSVCNQSFSNLRTHMASHLDAKARPFKCAFCFRGFARNNDLQRHQKKHLLERNLAETPKGSTVAGEQLMTLLNVKNSKKKHENNVCATPLGFQCPFFSNNNDQIGYPDDEDYVPNRCHTTGIFTRCDTFKNHLKALHFKYPKGTNRKDRPKVEGYCKHCSVKYANCKKWVDEHVLPGCCLKNRPFKSYMVGLPAADSRVNLTLLDAHPNHNGKVQSRDSETVVQVIPSRTPTTPNILDLNIL